MAQERQLFPDVCSRCGHAGNEERTRQDWTNYQLRSLVKNLQAHKIEAFPSIFMYYHQNKHHHEWASDHPEVMLTYDNEFGESTWINILARLNDGTLFEDIFIPQLVRAFYGSYGHCDGQLNRNRSYCRQFGMG